MRVTYKQFYRRFGKLVSSNGERMPVADDITPPQVHIFFCVYAVVLSGQAQMRLGVAGVQAGSSLSAQIRPGSVVLAVFER